MVEINPYEIIMQILNFLILLWLLNKFLFTPLGAFLDKRSNEIKDNIDSSQKIKQESEKVLINAKKELDKSKRDASSIISQALEEGIKEKKEIIDEAHARVNDIVRLGKRDVERSVGKAKTELKNQIADIAVDIAGKIVMKQVTIEDNEQIIKDHLIEVSELK